MKKTTLILCVAIMIVISSLFVHADENPILGEWVSAKRTAGGLGGSKYYKQDGTVIATFGALIDYKYKLTGNILSLYNQEGELSSEEEFKISGSNLFLKNVKTSKEQKLERYDGDHKNGIIGKWIGENDTGKKWCFHFTENMNCYFSVPLAQVQGQYRFYGDKYM